MKEMKQLNMSVQNEQSHEAYKDVKGSSYDLFLPLGSVSFLITLNLFLFLPFTIYHGNIDEFLVPFTSVLSSFIIPSAGLILVLVAIGILFPKILRGRYISILFIVGLLIYIQGNFLVWEYGLLDGQGIDWTRGSWRGYIDSFVWIFLLVLALILSRRISRFIVPVTVIMIFMQLFMIGFAVIQQPKEWKQKRKIYSKLSPPPELFQFSSRQNVIHILMDAFQSDIFQEIIEEDPDIYSNALNGFTFFRETTGSFPTTKMSIPAIFSGKIYLNDVSMPNFLKSTLKGKTISNVLFEKGYRVHLALCEGIDPSGGAGKYNVKYLIPVPYNVTEKKYDLANSGLMLDLVLFRCVPHFIKKYIYNNQEWLFQRLVFTRPGVLFFPHKDREGISTFRFFSHKMFFNDVINNMTVNLNQPVYKYIHLAGTHTPYIINENCKYAGHVLSFTRVNKKIQCRCCLNQFIEFLKKLKSMDIYDSSLIILSADTGDSIGVNLKNRNNQINDTISSIKNLSKIVGSALPLLAIKPPNERIPLKVSNAQTMLSDIPATVNAILNLNVEFPGENAFQIDPWQKRNRRFYYYKWHHENWQHDYFERMDEFIINGSVFDKTSWRKGVTLYSPKDSLNDKKLEQEGFQYSMKVLKDYRVNTIKAKKNEIFNMPILLENTSRQKWVVKGNYKINLAYHWLKKNGEKVIHDGIRSAIPRNLNPSDKVEISAKVKAPNVPGEYIVEFDMVQEQVAWFGSRGAETLKLNVVVK